MKCNSKIKIKQLKILIKLVSILKTINKRKAKTMAQTILYYPKINIKDGQWLRNALLYWDNVSSIVPHKNYKNISSDLLFLQNLGVYEAIYPNTLLYSKYARAFEETVKERILKYEEDTKTNLSKVYGKKIRISDTYDELIHYKKFSRGFYDYLEEKKYIKENRITGWVKIDMEIAQIYMRTLAEFSVKCSRKDIVLGTDKISNNREIYSSTICQNDSRCCHLNIIKCLPQPSCETSFEDILEFKLRREDELKAFREKIRELEENIYRSNSLEEIKHYENKFVESWETYYSDYAKALKDSKIRFVLGNLCTLIAIPSIGNVLTQHIGQDFSNVVQMGAGLLQMGISYIDYRNKINPNKTDGGFSYIINARDEGIILA